MISRSTLKLSLSQIILVRFSSSLANKSEISIPTLYGNISGTLWTPKSSSRLGKSEGNEPSVPILCMHGIADNSGSFSPLISHLLEEYKLNQTFLSIDLPGHGHSYHAKGNYYDFTLEGPVVIQRILRHFGWEKISLLAHSMGSGIGFLFTGTYPETVHKYVALDFLRPHLFNKQHVQYRKIVSSVLELESTLLSNRSKASYTYEEILERFYASRGGGVSKEGCKILLERGSERVLDFPGHYTFTHDVLTRIPLPPRNFSDEQLEHLGRRITCPVCVIKAIPGFELEPTEDFEKYIAFLQKSNPSRVEYHTVPGSHYLHLNSPHLVAPIINKFFRS